MRPPRRPKRSWWRRLAFWGVALLLLGSGGWLLLSWLGNLELRSLMAQMDQADPNWRLHDFLASRRKIPDEENSALVVTAAKKLMKGQSVSWPRGEVFERLFEGLPAQTQFNEQQVAHLVDRFQLLDKAAFLARKLKDMPHGRYAIVYSPDWLGTLLPDIQHARQVAELLQWDAYRRVHALDADGGIESCQALINTARSVDDEAFLITNLVRVAITHIAVAAVERVLAQGQPSELALRDLQKLLELEAAQPNLYNAIRGERAGGHQLMLAIAEGKVNFKGLIGARQAGDDWRDQLLLRVPGTLVRQHAALLRYYNEIVEIAKLPAHEQEERLAEIEGNIKLQPFLVRLLGPAMGKVAEANRRNQAYLGATILAVAAERYRLKHQAWPESLEFLVKEKLIDALPADPYVGGPMRMKKLHDGLVLYSVGRDKEDNGGHLDRLRVMDPGVDYGFRLWDVPFRRQPPRPPVPLEDLEEKN